jgi:hypothetical protein
VELREMLDAPESAEEIAALDALVRDPKRVLAAARRRAGRGALRMRRRWPIAAALAAGALLALLHLFGGAVPYLIHGGRAEKTRSPSATRRAELASLRSAATPAEVAAARTDAPDLLALQRKLSRLTPAQMEEHARLHHLYAILRDQAAAGTADVAEVEEFARYVVLDPTLWAPALQLAADIYRSRGDQGAVGRFEASIASACPLRGCAAEDEAVAVDALAKAAAREGDSASAHKLQARLEALLQSIGVSSIDSLE